MRPQPPGIPSPWDWRRRTAGIFDDLRRHAATRSQIARKWFVGGGSLATGLKKASRWLTKMRRRKKVRAVCVVQRRETGRPETCYGKRPKVGEELHQVSLYDAEWFLRCRIETGVRLGKARPDGVAVIAGRTVAIEVDNSRMSRKQMAAKWRSYDGVDAFILVITVREERMQKLRANAASSPVADRAFFSTFARLEKVSEPWMDCVGKSIRLG
jgi:hypothetical protein